MRTITWDDEKQALQMIDQRLLPGVFRINTYENPEEIAEAIRSMVVRGAPAIGAAAAFGMALAALQCESSSTDAIINTLEDAAKLLKEARPTAVNLTWAVNRMQTAAAGFSGSAQDLQTILVKKAKEIADDDVMINKRMATFGAALIEDGDQILHHCNTGALATVDWGTALGVIRMAHEQGKKIHVLVDETRPRLQGMRLTAWELEQYNIPYDIITDNSAGYLMRRGMVQKVFFGADRVVANGDVANKIGTYMLSLAAYDNGVPTYCVAPTSTIDFQLERGDLIPIEERDDQEVLDVKLMGQAAAPKQASARNFAFDITPHRLISGWVTELGVVRPPFKENMHALMESQRVA